MVKVKNVYLKNANYLVGEVEKNISRDLDFMNNNYFGLKSTEQAEIKMNEWVIEKSLCSNPKLVIGGNLTNQIASLSYALPNYHLPYLGLYSACSTFTESIIVGAKFLKEYNNILLLVSSHNLNSEKQFRFPIEYGSPKPIYATNTLTGVLGTILTKEETNIKVESYTIGEVIDYKITDSANMGAIMAPACFNTIKKHLTETKRNLSYYDVVVTGDLGRYGLEILKRLLDDEKLLTAKVIDAGYELSKNIKNQYAGFSGPVCLPLFFFHRIIKNNHYHKVLIVGSGALHTKILVDQHLSIPAISHVVSLEVK